MSRAVDLSETECPTCGEEFDTERAVKIHHSMVHDKSIVDPSGAFQCPTCGQGFNSEHAMKIHHSKLHGETLVERYNGDHECPTCRKGFDAERSMKIHHSKIHGESLAGVQTDCDFCGETIRKEPAELKAHEYVFCDNTCRGKWLSENHWHTRDPDNYIEVSCAQCDAVFERLKSDAESNQNYFCSRDCQGAWLSENRAGEDHPLFKGKRVEKVCENCGSEFRVYESLTRIKYCSKGCYHQNLEGQTGPDHPTWKGGHEGYYGPSWPKQRKAALERDGHRCQDCGISGDEHVELVGEELHVHHITPFRKFDDHEEANPLNNLVTLCRSCHLGKWESLTGLRPDNRAALSD